MVSGTAVRFGLSRFGLRVKPMQTGFTLEPMEGNRFRGGTESQLVTTCDENFFWLRKFCPGWSVKTDPKCFKNFGIPWWRYTLKKRGESESELRIEIGPLAQK